MQLSLRASLVSASAIVIAATIAVSSFTELTASASAMAGERSDIRSAADDVGTIGPAFVAPAASFTAAERLLLKGIPWRIRKTCVPRRSALARGTVAAVQCRPASRVVSDMAYYLMDSGPAYRVFEQRRKQAGVRRGGSCLSGKPRYDIWIGGMPTAELCYRNSDGRANLRILEPATNCRKLKVAGRTLRTPTIYIAVLGRDGDIGKLDRWATGNGRESPSVLTRPIRQPGSGFSPSCLR